jgi:hypothetical protein
MEKTEGYADMMELTKTQEAQMTCIAAIVLSLKNLGYQHPQYTGFKNPDNDGLIILATSPDGETDFAIEVRTWVKDKTPINFGKFGK